MKLLHMIGSMDPSSGGPCQVIRNTVPELEKLGVCSEILCFDDPLASFLIDEPLKVRALGSSKNAWCYSKALKPWLFKNLSQYDVIVTHGLWLYHSYALSKAIDKLKSDAATEPAKCKLPRVFVMPHGMLDPYFQRAPERKFKALRNIIYWALIEKKVIREADGLLFTCEEELRLARTCFSQYHPKQEQNIGLGIIEPPPFNLQMQEAFQSKCGSLGDDPYFLFLGRIHIKKGVDILLEAYAKLLETYISMHSGHQESIRHCKLSSIPKLVIAGPGIETSFGQKIKKIIQGNEKLKGAVFLPGMLAGDAKWGAFYGCEAFILPSHQENFGIAVAEALACSKPVLTSNKVNIWREIKNSDGGLVAVDTLEGTFEMLQVWMGLSLSDKASIGPKARLTFEKYFSIGPASEKLVEVITQDLENNV